MFLQTLKLLPLPFWIAVGLLAYGLIHAGQRLNSGTGLPRIAVLGTIAAWYLGDIFYNDYPNHFVPLFSPATLSEAWWQVTLFLLIFLWLTPRLHLRLNRAYLERSSSLLRLFRDGPGDLLFQEQIARILWGCLIVWGVLVGLAGLELGGELPYYLFPYLGYRADPWSRGAIGGSFDSLLSLASNVNALVASGFGLVLALSTRASARLLALLGCLLTWPYFLIDRVRNVMLAVALPALLAWIFIRFRGPIFARFALLGGIYLLTSSWLAFIIETRDSHINVNEIEGYSLTELQQVHQRGLNMFEELCWINGLMDQGIYRPNLGERYLAELANPIPRGLWAGKPLIGIDYALARGMENPDDTEGIGVHATISTGLIGQGVVNFGKWVGPAFAALLMSLWACLLARLDLSGDRLGRVPLLLLGLVVTFNLGRDITFLSLYTFCFGLLFVLLYERASAGPLVDGAVHPTDLPTSSHS